MNEPKVELLLNIKSILGETPVYDYRTNEIVWVDIDGMTINILDLTTNKNRVIEFGDFVGAAIPCRSGKNIIALSKQDIILVDKETGDKKLVATATNDKSNRFNDAHCDCRGRVWSGTITIVEGAPGTFCQEEGMLFSFDGANVKCHERNLSISNGIAWSRDWSKMYLVDSLPQLIYSFDFDKQTGNISNKKVAIDMKNEDYIKPLPLTEKSIDLKSHHNAIIPDGICIDCEGKLWIAEHNGGCVSRWDPENGQLLKKVKIPALKVTACCFGGPEYDTLYVTTASVYSSSEDWQLYPQAGGLFAVTNLGVKGFPIQFFNDSNLTH